MNLSTVVRRIAAPIQKLFLRQPTGGWYPVIKESFAGAWQRNITVDQQSVAANWALFANATLIANDIAKMPARAMRYDGRDRIWIRTNQYPVLIKPNHFQTWPDFIRSWVFSLLFRGNAYILLVRGRTGDVEAMYVLDPSRVTPLVSDSGQVFYQLDSDNLANVGTTVTVPASEVMHDRINCIYHPLCGLSPIFASGIAAMQGLAMQESSATFFMNNSQPGGVMTAPGAISDDTAERLKENFASKKPGELLVLGDGLKYEAMTISAKDAQLIEQLKFTGEMICATFHVPPYKLGLGQMPTTNNVAALNQQYYDQCLHPITDGIERRLDEGLRLETPFEEVWFDTSELLRMDPSTRFDAHSKAIGGGWFAPNEARRQEDLPSVDGGDTPYMQQQNYSLAALALRDARAAEASDDVQAQAMTGAQVTSLQGLLTSAALGQIPIETVAAAIAAAFPLLTPQQIQSLVAPLENFEPSGDTPPPEEPSMPTDDEARAWVRGVLAA